MEAPKGTDSLIIEHCNWSLGGKPIIFTTFIKKLLFRE